MPIMTIWLVFQNQLGHKCHGLTFKDVYFAGKPVNIGIIYKSNKENEKQI